MRRLLKLFKKSYLIVLFLFSSLLFSGFLDHLFTESFAYYKHRGPQQPLEWLIHQLNFENVLIKPPNPYNYGYRIPNANCGNRSAPNDLVIAVKSALKHFQLRKVIRQTWGNVSQYRNFNVAVVFMVGSTPDKNLQDKVTIENVYYRDILQGGFKEDYYNLTVKTLMGLHWLDTQCKYFKYAMFVDDDSYVSPKNTLTYLIDPEAYPTNEPIKKTDVITGEHKDFLVGRMPIYRLPMRIKFSKYYVSLADYPYTIYPPFITGGVQIISRYSIKKLYLASIFTDFYRYVF